MDKTQRSLPSHKPHLDDMKRAKAQLAEIPETKQTDLLKLKFRLANPEHSDEPNGGSKWNDLDDGSDSGSENGSSDGSDSDCSSDGSDSDCSSDGSDIASVTKDEIPDAPKKLIEIMVAVTLQLLQDPYLRNAVTKEIVEASVENKADFKACHVDLMAKVRVRPNFHNV